MTAQKFSPRTMKLSLLTAAFQELTPRDKRDADPDVAIEDWLQFARQIGSPYIQLSAALHPSRADVPAQAMLDPVANTLDLREPFNQGRAARVGNAIKASGVGLSDLGYFDNMLAADAGARARKHDFMLRVFDAHISAVALIRPVNVIAYNDDVDYTSRPLAGGKSVSGEGPGRRACAGADLQLVRQCYRQRSFDSAIQYPEQ